MKAILQTRIDSYKEKFLDTVCAPDRDGPLMPYVNMKTNFEYYPNTQIVSTQYDDLSRHTAIGGDGEPNYYYVNHTELVRATPTVFSEVRTLTEFAIPRYQYPHGFYFKCIVTA